MAELLLFHHGHGLTEGVRQFAHTAREAGHTVHTPDLFEGRVFDDLAEGMAYVDNIGLRAVLERGSMAARDLPPTVVYAGFSLGVLPAQQLTQTRPGARGALLFHSCVPAATFGAWPVGVPTQVHAMEDDPWFVGDGDIDAARNLLAVSDRAALFLYPGAGHLFADPGLPDYDEAAAEQLTRRALGLLAAVDLRDRAG